MQFTSMIKWNQTPLIMLVIMLRDPLTYLGHLLLTGFLVVCVFVFPWMRLISIVLIMFCPFLVYILYFVRIFQTPEKVVFFVQRDIRIDNAGVYEEADSWSKFLTWNAIRSISRTRDCHILRINTGQILLLSHINLSAAQRQRLEVLLHSNVK